MAKNRNYRAFREIEEDYFRKHPEEIAPYIDEIFDEYGKDGNAAALLASLRVIARAKGITHLAEETGMTRQGIQHALGAEFLDKRNRHRSGREGGAERLHHRHFEPGRDGGLEGLMAARRQPVAAPLLA